MDSLKSFIYKIPKAELHLHIEGTFEPELMFKIARRNKINLPYKSAGELRKAYDFGNLQDFLDIYYQGANVLLRERDFYDLTRAYISKVRGQNVRHAEIFFDPQTHTGRGVHFDAVICGIHRALEEARKKYGMTSRLIMCFLRHLDEKSAMLALKESLKYKKWIIAVGLDSSEYGNPPSKFERVFAEARKCGFLAVAHAGEEGPSQYVREALSLLRVSRVDHGNRSLSDANLVRELASRKIPLTVCPLSNLKLGVVKNLKKHPLKKMMEKGLLVTVNSDDPAYFGGYLAENYLAVAKALNLTRDEIRKLAENSFVASFLDGRSKKQLISEVKKYSL